MKSKIIRSCIGIRFFNRKQEIDSKMESATEINWTASSEFGTYCLCEQRRFRRACASAQSRQNLRCSLIQAVSQEEPSYRKPDPWPLWMAGHAQLKFVMTECSKTQIRLAGLNCSNEITLIEYHFRLVKCVKGWLSFLKNWIITVRQRLFFKMIWSLKLKFRSNVTV